MSRRLFLLLFALSPLLAHAHVNSPNVIFEGRAGLYPVRVVIRPPGVVPGLAEISVRVHTNGARLVSVLPVHWRAGIEGSPPPDVARPVAGEAGLYHAELWFMARGAYSVHVKVEGEHGAGTVSKPFLSFSLSPDQPVGQADGSVIIRKKGLIKPRAKGGPSPDTTYYY